ncbi:MAG TPA: O-antigen ligase family protein [Prolixibacteraceae bacterium]|nr:O-antigen ligase family protein [Prolixibacteraceae bacterium]
MHFVLNHNLVVAAIVGGCLAGTAILFLPLTLVVVLLIGVSIMVLLHRYVTVMMYFLISLTLLGRTFLGFDFDTAWSNNATIFPFYIPFLLPVLTIRNINGLSGTSLPVKNSAFIPILILLCLWSMLSLMWTANKLHGVLFLLELMVNISIFFFCIFDLNSEEKLRRVLGFWCFFGFIIATLSVSFHFLPLGGPYELEVELLKNFYLRGKIAETQIRAMGIANPNSMALIMNLSIYITLALWATTKTMKKKFLYLAISLYFTFVILLTGSKGGVLSFLSAFFVLLILYNRFRKNMIIVLIVFTTLFIVLMGMFFILTESKGNRLAGALSVSGKTISDDETSFGSRFVMWEQGFTKLFLESYGLGLGPGGFTHHCKPHPHAHNFYFSILFDFGVIGLLFLVLFLITLLQNFTVPIRHQKTRMHVVSIFLLAGMVAMSIQSLVDHMYSRTVIWLYLGIMVSTPILDTDEFIHKETKVQAP